MHEIDDTHRLLRTLPASVPSLALLWIPPLVIGLTGIPLHVTSIDQQVFVWLHQFGWHAHPAVWQWLTVLGDGLVAFALMALFARRYPQLLWIFMIAAPLGALWTHSLKWALGGPRPVAVLDPSLLQVIGPVLESNSLPSGHTLTIVSFCGIWILTSNRPAVIVSLFALALLVSVSRVMVGAHWPIDVIYGALSGWFVAVAAVWLSRRWRWGLGAAAQRWFNVMLLMFSGLLFFHDSGYPASKWLLIGFGAVGVAASLANLLRPTLVRQGVDGTIHVYDANTAK